ncbi:MAG: cytochrome b6-f complex subunit 6 [Pseudanabaenales cyanobacterium]|nr:cytochrome b6-f complex subunit 6 [Pseudanabaenales cyanobacterium]
MLGTLIYFVLLGAAFGTALGLYFGLRAFKLI